MPGRGMRGHARIPILPAEPPQSKVACEPRGEMPFPFGLGSHKTGAPMKIVVAYSGGLDTSVLLTWLKETYQAEIVAFCADVGQEEELDGIEAKALRTGAAKCYIDDLREEFARDFIFPMFQAGAIYEGQYYLGTSIARPLIAKRMVEIARQESANAVANGATGKGNDQVRFELTVAALAPEIEVIAPWRQERFRNQFPGRTEMIEFAEKNGIPVAASAKKPYSDRKSTR